MEYNSDQIVATFVNFDEDALNINTLIPVEAFATHPDYSWTPASNRHDVGLLLLDEDDTKGIPAATLPDEGFLDEKKKAHELHQGKEEVDFMVVGYGGTLYCPPPSVEYEDKRQFAESEYQTLTKS